MADAAPHTFTALGDEAFVSLTTFRRTGEPVPTPVWIAKDGDALVVTTPAESGKVKRLRNNPLVELRPSSRTGKVADDAVSVGGTVEIVTDDTDAERMNDLIRQKYGMEYRIVMGIERIAARGRKERVLLRITPQR